MVTWFDDCLIWTMILSAGMDSEKLTYTATFPIYVSKIKMQVYNLNVVHGRFPAHLDKILNVELPG